MDLGYARVSTAQQDLERQLDALGQTGIPRTTLYRHLPPRPPEPTTPADPPAIQPSDLEIGRPDEEGSAA